MEKTSDKATITRINRGLLITLLIVFICLFLGACGPSAPKKVDSITTPSTDPVQNTEPTESAAISLPVFSVNAGFYEEPFSLALATEGGCEIYYTMDGSDPRESDTAVLYVAEINIYNNSTDPNHLSAIADITLDSYTPPVDPVDKAMVVRAAVKNADGNFSDVVTNSYFVGKDKAYYTDMQVVSLVADEDYLFHPDTGFYRIGSEYYEWLNSDEHKNYATGDPQNPTNYNIDGKKSEFPASVQVFYQGEPVYSANVGTRLSGNWTRAFPQKSFRLYAREEYGTDKMEYDFIKTLFDAEGNVVKSYDKVTMRNGGNDNGTLHFRDVFFQDLTDELATDYMAFEPCTLFINGEFWGFYFFREKPDDDYINARYGIDKDDVALLKNSEVESGEDSDLEEFNRFCAWAMTADMQDPANYSKFCEVMDLQSFMDYITVETYLNNADWIDGYVNNWQIWHTRTIHDSVPRADSKWRFILYDMDVAAGLHNKEKAGYAYDSLNKNSAPGSFYDFLAILKSLMANQEFAAQFKENYIRIIDTYFAPSVVDALLDHYVEKYKEVTLDTFYRFGMDRPARHYDESVEQLREFFHQRPAYAKQYLEKFCSVDYTVPKALVPPVEKWSFSGDATYEANAEEKAFYVSIPSSFQESWRIQSKARNIPLIKGQTYRITFKASCTNPGSIDCGLTRQSDGKFPNCFWQAFQVTEELQEYDMQFTMQMDTNYDWYLNFNFGKITGDCVIKDVVIESLD